MVAVLFQYDLSHEANPANMREALSELRLDDKHDNPIQHLL